MQDIQPTAANAETWSRPAFEVIPLDCEITAYAPDDGERRPEF
jgi:hypothetical protein